MDKSQESNINKSKASQQSQQLKPGQTPKPSDKPVTEVTLKDEKNLANKSS